MLLCHQIKAKLFFDNNIILYLYEFQLRLRLACKPKSAENKLALYNSLEPNPKDNINNIYTKRTPKLIAKRSRQNLVVCVNN